MDDLILLVEDDETIQLNIKMILEFNNYRVVIANDGSQALDILNKLKKPPDLIISDIKMPKMDGFEFFKAVSFTRGLNQVPFIFLSALSQPEDIRFAKMLGADDYITKPFKEDDLLAIIKGKIKREQNSRSFSNTLEKNIFNGLSMLKKSTSLELFIIVKWNDIKGPILDCAYPKDQELLIEESKLLSQLFASFTKIYGKKTILEAKDLLVNIKEIKKHGYLFFDSYPDKRVQGGMQIYLMAFIADTINYFDYLNIQKIFIKISRDYKYFQNCDFLDRYWEEIKSILNDFPAQV